MSRTSPLTPSRGNGADADPHPSLPGRYRWCDGFWAALSILVCKNGGVLRSEGMGDVNQQGGVFCFDGAGKCHYAHRATDYDDNPPHTEVLAALRAAAGAG